MPQTTPERGERWDNHMAVDHLKGGGWILRRDWVWWHPDKTRQPTNRELDASRYLVEEWDYGGIVVPPKFL